MNRKCRGTIGNAGNIKLNFGCGVRYVLSDWENIDFMPAGKEVKRVNLLCRLPYSNESFVVAYSSHVLEHFTRKQAVGVLQEIYRVLKPGGIIRIVVPDLEDICREYLRILSEQDGTAEKYDCLNWMVIEMIDQMTRDTRWGDMGAFIQQARQPNAPKEVKRYVSARWPGVLSWNVDGYTPCEPLLRRAWRVLSVDKISAFLLSKYLRCVRSLVPCSVRPMVWTDSALGDRHKWMYDFHQLNSLLTEVGFINCKRMTFNRSMISGFNEDCLDCNADGTSYKGGSLYIEGVKP